MLLCLSLRDTQAEEEALHRNTYTPAFKNQVEVSHVVWSPTPRPVPFSLTCSICPSPSSVDPEWMVGISVETFYQKSLIISLWHIKILWCFPSLFCPLFKMFSLPSPPLPPPVVAVRSLINPNPGCRAGVIPCLVASRTLMPPSPGLLTGPPTPTVPAPGTGFPAS